MGLDDFATDSSSSSSGSSSSNTGPPKKEKKDPQNVDIDDGDIDEDQFTFVIKDPRDPAWEVDGIEHLNGVAAAFDTDEFPSGKSVTNEVVGEYEGMPEPGELEIIDATDTEGDDGDLEQRNPSEHTTVTKKGSNTVKIKKSEFEQALANTGLPFQEVDYSWASECIYEAQSKNGTFALRVYSTIEQRDAESRGTGEDSIKIQVVHAKSGRPVISTSRTYRTPGWAERLQEKVKELKDRKSEIIKCSECGSLMVIRENNSTGDKFYGCSQYPECKNTEPYNE